MKLQYNSRRFLFQTLTLIYSESEFLTLFHNWLLFRRKRIELYRKLLESVTFSFSCFRGKREGKGWDWWSSFSLFFSHSQYPWGRQRDILWFVSFNRPSLSSSSSFSLSLFSILSQLSLLHKLHFQNVNCSQWLQAGNRSSIGQEEGGMWGLRLSPVVSHCLIWHQSPFLN